MPKSLAEAHIKVAVLTSAPANPAVPTAAELAGAISAATRILASDFVWSATDSDKVNEKSLADANNSNALSASNFTTGLTVFRFFNASTGVAEPTEDTLWAAAKTKGTRLWIYVRETGKLETAAWAAADEVYLGGEVLTDSPQKPSNAGGYIKRRIPLEPQTMYQNIAVG